MNAMPSALIQPSTLAARLRDGDPSIRMVDATMPPRPDLFSRARIGNAVMFDVDAVSNHADPLPHMLPDAGLFAEAASALGIGPDDDVIVYDQSGIAMAAARVWWMFRIFGHHRVHVLDGGLPLWTALGLPLNDSPPIMPAPSALPYPARFDPALVADRFDVLGSIDDPGTLVLDARPAARFNGVAPEPRPGMRAGHIPESRSLPYPSLLDPASGRLNPGDAQVQAIAAAPPARVIASCGSGITACVLALALYEAGLDRVAIYDGSWSEWGQTDSGLPIAR